MPLVDSLTNFRNSVAETNTFIALAFQQDASNNYILPQNQRDFITDSAFLRVFISWETFLESSFIKYMLGEPSILGNSITRFVQPRDESHANSLLIGTNKYIDWANPDIIRRLCNLHFAPGNPIDTFLSAIRLDLLDLKTIRNAAAHLTSTTRTQLDSLGTRRLRRPCSNLKVSDFIFAIDPDSTSSSTILKTYLDKLDISAEGIANG